MPYLHMSIADFDDGSSYEIWIVNPRNLLIVPGPKCSVAALLRFTNYLFSEGYEGEVIPYLHGEGFQSLAEAASRIERIVNKERAVFQYEIGELQRLLSLALSRRPEAPSELVAGMLAYLEEKIAYLEKEK